MVSAYMHSFPIIAHPHTKQTKKNTPCGPLGCEFESV